LLPLNPISPLTSICFYEIIINVSREFGSSGA
jgi:hypothetical protein